MSDFAEPSIKSLHTFPIPLDNRGTISITKMIAKWHACMSRVSLSRIFASPFHEGRKSFAQRPETTRIASLHNGTAAGISATRMFLTVLPFLSNVRYVKIVNTMTAVFMIYFVFIYDDFGVMRAQLIYAFKHWAAARTTSASKRSARWQASNMVQNGRPCWYKRASHSQIEEAP